MSPRRKAPDAMRQAGNILSVLASKLPDEVLQDYFHDLSPKQIRKILQEAVAVLAPQKDVKVKPPSQATLWQGREKSWKGGLAGQTLQLFSDGASRGNPGEAGAGIAIYDEQGNELIGTGQYLGQCTNNEAEYRALLLGLSKCAELGRGSLKVHLDSELLVKQVLGEYRVRHPNLIPLFQETMQKVTGFSKFSITHVRREKNRRADQLANEAIDDHEK